MLWHKQQQGHECPPTHPDNDADWLLRIAKKEQPLAVTIRTAPPFPPPTGFTHHSRVKGAHTGTLSFPPHSDQPDILYFSNATGLQICWTSDLILPRVPCEMRWCVCSSWNDSWSASMHGAQSGAQVKRMRLCLKWQRPYQWMSAVSAGASLYKEAARARFWGATQSTWAKAPAHRWNSTHYNLCYNASTRKGSDYRRSWR